MGRGIFLLACTVFSSPGSREVRATWGEVQEQQGEQEEKEDEEEQEVQEE